MTLELSEKKNILLHSYILMVHNMHIKGGGRFEMGVQNHRGLGDGSPQKLKNFKSSYKQILRIYW